MNGAVETQDAPSEAGRPRLDGVDLLRGVVMILMAIDHSRDFLGGSIRPLDLAHTTPAWFFTRWITHFCAPVFVLLAGTGAFLSSKPKPALARFLLVRGLLLIAIELTLLHWINFFTLSYEFFQVQVLWALGWSMIVLAALVWLPVRAVALLGVAMIALHNLLDGVASPSLWWGILHVQGAHELDATHTLFVTYPLVPWIGVMAAGYGLGALLRRPDRKRVLVVLGAALTLAFLVLRALNGYGDPQPWSVQPRAVFTALSFLNTAKYPPSLAFLLMTLGPALLALGLTIDRVPGPLARSIIVYGRVPFFFYLAHMFILHLARVIAQHTMGDAAAEAGFGLGCVYAAWLGVLVLLYPACGWYARLKARRHDLQWLSYL